MAKVHHCNLGLSMSTTTMIPTGIISATTDQKEVTCMTTPINTGEMHKKGKVNPNWKRRYFELFHDGKLVYYTNQSKQTRKGVADLTCIIGFHAIDNKTFEVITPQRNWCFQCKFKSECDYWIESMKEIEHSYLHHDASTLNPRDSLKLSVNGSVLKLIAKMGPPAGETILYSDRVHITKMNGKQRHESTVLMLTSMALYHLPPNQNHIYKKCDRRMSWRDVACCTVLNPKTLSIAEVEYQTETGSLRAILQAVTEADNEVLFQRVEDEQTFRSDLEQEAVGLHFPMKSISFIRSANGSNDIQDLDREVNASMEPGRQSEYFSGPSYVDPDGIDTASFELECGFGSSESVDTNESSDGSHRTVSTLNSLLRQRSTTDQSAQCVAVESRYSRKKSLRARDFDFLSVIGRGSFGKILLVQKKGKDTVFAMKILKKKQIIQNQLERHIKAEREVLKSIDHPFLMKLRYAFQSESKLYFVLDYYRGGDLNHHLQQRGRFNDEETKFIAAQIALAIGCLHSHGIVYRDLKPENILMDDVGNCCLTDFGLCKDLSDYTASPCDSRRTNKRRRRLNSTKTPCGTAEYLAPEVIKELPYDQNVDWWSFGILIFELTVGVVPFFSMSKFDMFQKITSAQLRFPSWIEEDCQLLIGSLLQRTVSQRLGFLNDIDDIKTHQWFDDVDWDLMLQKKVDPPYCPNVDPSEGMESRPQNVAQRFLKEAAVDTFAPKPDVDGLFDGFTFNGKAANGPLAGSKKVTGSKRGNGKSGLPISEMLNNLTLLDDEMMGKLQEAEDEEAEDEEGDQEEQ